MDDPKDNLESKTLEIFRRAREVSLEAPPYLETRVLAVLRERQAGSRRFAVWKGLAMSCAALSVAAVTYAIFEGSGSPYRAEVHQAMVVSVEVMPLESARIAYAEVDLPANVTFYSKNHPELEGQRSLTIAWKPDSGHSSRFPFAIQADRSGERTVYVRFRDADHNLISEKAFRIRFSERAKG